VAGLAGNRAAVRGALAPLVGAGGAVGRGRGAIYHWAALPPGPGGAPADDAALVAWLVARHGVCTIPGSACGSPGHIRAAFGNLAPGACAEAAARLAGGLEEYVLKGLV
jgi:katanin p60 ATPase-containing subunit A1